MTATQGSPMIFAIPSKGRLKDQVEAWLAECGFKLEMTGGARGYSAELSGLPGVSVRLLSAGVLHPLADLLANHDLPLFLAHLLASLRVLADLGRIRRHARLCARPGAHFLTLDAP